MSPELDWTLVVLVRVLAVYFILLIVTSLATLFLTVLGHFHMENVLKMLSGATVLRLPPNDTKGN